MDKIILACFISTGILLLILTIISNDLRHAGFMSGCQDSLMKVYEAFRVKRVDAGSLYEFCEELYKDKK